MPHNGRQPQSWAEDTIQSCRLEKRVAGKKEDRPEEEVEAQTPDMPTTTKKKT
jgi:hypothetical protein